MKPLLVLCLGNEVLSDDAFGPTVAARLLQRGVDDDLTEIVYTSQAGFGLLDLLQERKSVLIVDAIQTGVAEPGTLQHFPAGIFTPSYGLVNSHQISLPTALEFGRRIGYEMPEDIQVLACEAGDVETLAEKLTPPVAEAVEPAIAKVEEWIRTKRKAVIELAGPLLA